jgi:glutaredoxin
MSTKTHLINWMSNVADKLLQVFSKSYCPYCTRAKGILSSYSAIKPRLQVRPRQSFRQKSILVLIGHLLFTQILELDEMGKEGQAIQDALATKLGKSRVTVPQVRSHCTILIWPMWQIDIYLLNIHLLTRRFFLLAIHVVYVSALSTLSFRRSSSLASP